MIIAIPTLDSKLCQHFGHCQSFMFVEVDETVKKIINTKQLVPPPHEPGILPAWVKSNGANVVIAGGMGGRAQSLFMEQGIKVITGCVKLDVQEIVKDYINNTLQTGVNACDH